MKINRQTYILLIVSLIAGLIFTVNADANTRNIGADYLVKLAKKFQGQGRVKDAISEGMGDDERSIRNFVIYKLRLHKKLSVQQFQKKAKEYLFDPLLTQSVF